MPTEIDRAEVQRLVAGGVPLLDVLPEEEFASEHLRGAVNLPLTRLERRSVAQLDPARPVIVYCNDTQ